MINDVPERDVHVVVSDKDFKIFLRKVQGVWVPKEYVIGGEETKNEPVQMKVIPENVTFLSHFPESLRGRENKIMVFGPSF